MLQRQESRGELLLGGGSTVLLLFTILRTPGINKYCSSVVVQFLCISNRLLLLLGLL